jgi:hypothetical protein
VYGFTHYKRIVDSGAVRLARDREQLMDFLNAYLADRSIDADKRRAARGQFVTYTDGAAAARIAARVWDAA